MNDIISNFIKKPLGFLGSFVTISISVGAIILDHFNVIDIGVISQYLNHQIPNQELIENERLLGILGINGNELPLDVKNQIFQLFREHPENEIPLGEIQRLLGQYQNLQTSTPDGLPSLAIKSPDLESVTTFSDVVSTTTTSNITENPLNSTSVVKK